MPPIHRSLPNRIPTLVVNRRFDRPHPLPVTGSASQALDPRLAAKVRAAYAAYEPPTCRPLEHEGVQKKGALRTSVSGETTPRRDQRGRFQKRLDRPETATFPMSDDQIRAAARRILSHCPTGTKKPLALACGFKGEWALHTLRGIAKGRAKLVDATRRRLCDTLGRVLSGELVPVTTGRRGGFGI